MKSWSSLAGLALATAVLLAGCGARQAEPLAQQIDDIVRSAHKSGKFSGAVLVTRKDQTIYAGSFGFADAQKNIPNTAETRYLAFSVVKPMTAVLVFQLVYARKLRLTDTLESFFPNLKVKPAGQLTLQQLLTHTSDISEVISDHRDRRITPQDLEAAVVKRSGDFEYSNTGYVTLGLVLEAVTGQTYEQLMREKILQPADMKDSGLVRTGQPIPNLARGYQLKAGKPVPVEMDVPLEILDGAGSLFTTARDLWRFDQALAKETILSRKMQDLMLTQQVKDRYGYGWYLSEQGGRYYPWHKGDYRGYTAIFVRQIHRQETIVILSNLQDADIADLRTKILRALKASPGR
jgi:CubicO group peptidase (beta-lactamase class C family)